MMECDLAQAMDFSFGEVIFLLPWYQLKCIENALKWTLVGNSRSVAITISVAKSIEDLRIVIAGVGQSFGVNADTLRCIKVRISLVNDGWWVVVVEILMRIANCELQYE